MVCDLRSPDSRIGLWVGWVAHFGGVGLVESDLRCGLHSNEACRTHTQRPYGQCATRFPLSIFCKCVRHSFDGGGRVPLIIYIFLPPFSPYHHPLLHNIYKNNITNLAIVCGHLDRVAVYIRNTRAGGLWNCFWRGIGVKRVGGRCPVAQQVVFYV